MFEDRLCLTGYERFVDLTFTLQDNAVGKQLGTAFQNDDIVKQNLVDRDFLCFAAPQYGCLRLRNKRQFFHRFFCAQLLKHADRDVAENNEHEGRVFIRADVKQCGGDYDIDEIEHREGVGENDFRNAFCFYGSVEVCVSVPLTFLDLCCGKPFRNGRRIPRCVFEFDETVRNWFGRHV
ncbi:unknown [Ruminococcus sp. CAG:382]|nr:unknown [Ruminococcus sp. CAG:382]